MASYRDLKDWQAAMDLSVEVYRVTARFPSEEKYGLVQQMKRAAVSVPSNIAEGYGRRTARQRYHFLESSLGSLFELETQVELATRLEFLHEPAAPSLADAICGIGRGLTALMDYVEREARTQKPRHTT